MSKRDAEIYRRAAEMLVAGESTRYSCCVIGDMAEEILDDYFIGDEYARRYARLFAPKQNADIDFWLDEACDNGKILHEEMREWRLTALCFMAAIAESGDA